MVARPTRPGNACGCWTRSMLMGQGLDESRGSGFAEATPDRDAEGAIDRTWDRVLFLFQCRIQTGNGGGQTVVGYSDQAAALAKSPLPLRDLSDSARYSPPPSQPFPTPSDSGSLHAQRRTSRRAEVHRLMNAAGSSLTRGDVFTVGMVTRINSWQAGST